MKIIVFLLAIFTLECTGTAIKRIVKSKNKSEILSHVFAVCIFFMITIGLLVNLIH